MRGDVREQVVLDLVAEVPAEDVEQATSRQVRRAEHLAQVPAAARLVLDLILGELLDARGEVPAEDDRERPHVAHEIRAQVPGEHERGGRACEHWERDVVLEHLATALVPDRAHDLALVRERDLTGLDPVELEVVGRDAPLEQEREQRRIQRVPEIAPAPRLVL